MTPHVPCAEYHIQPVPACNTLTAQQTAAMRGHGRRLLRTWENGCSALLHGTVSYRTVHPYSAVLYARAQYLQSQQSCPSLKRPSKWSLRFTPPPSHWRHGTAPAEREERPGTGRGRGRGGECKRCSRRHSPYRGKVKHRQGKSGRKEGTRQQGRVRRSASLLLELHAISCWSEGYSRATPRALASWPGHPGSWPGCPPKPPRHPTSRPGHLST